MLVGLFCALAAAASTRSRTSLVCLLYTVVPHSDVTVVVHGERIPERSSNNILPVEWLARKITSSLHESNFACYSCINGITSTADEYSFTSYNCISNITICGSTAEEDYRFMEISNVNANNH